MNTTMGSWLLQFDNSKAEFGNSPRREVLKRDAAKAHMQAIQAQYPLDPNPDLFADWLLALRQSYMGRFRTGGSSGGVC